MTAWGRGRVSGPGFLVYDPKKSAAPLAGAATTAFLEMVEVRR